jgi:hypothetical protein
MNKVLLIGCGYWGKNWYNTIKKTSSIELTGGKVVEDEDKYIDEVIERDYAYLYGR